jgi:hypothetical protein
MTWPARAPARVFPVFIYVIAFVTGGIVMSFEMLGSRYLNPYFGSGIYTWAALSLRLVLGLTLGSGTVSRRARAAHASEHSENAPVASAEPYGKRRPVGTPKEKD